MNNDETATPTPIFRGLDQDASYADQLIKRYSGIPTIEALPPIRSAEDVVKLLAHYPEREHGGQKLPSEIRMHLIMDAVHFFEPLPVHIDLEQRLSRVIRGQVKFHQGYASGLAALPRPNRKGETFVKRRKFQFLRERWIIWLNIV